MSKTKGFLLAVAVATMAFTFSCSSDDGEEKGGESSSSGGGEGSSSSVESSQFNPNINYTPFTDNRDGKSYKSVTIGTQVWMAENLNYETENSKCFDDDPENCIKYGRLYTWAEAKTACPLGYKLPSDEDWTQLTDFVGSNAGTKLKALSGWGNNYESGASGNGTDNYGFSALPGGYCILNIRVSPIECIFSGVGHVSHLWSSTEYTEYNSNEAWYWRFESTDNGFSHDEYAGMMEWELNSVRCVQDTP